MKTSVKLAAVAAVSALALAGCGGSSGSPTKHPAAGSSPSSGGSSSGGGSSAAKSMIMIKNYAFSGASSVSAGTKVTVMNADSVTHTLTSDTAGQFDVNVPAGGSATFTAPKKAGKYAYHCNFHSNMHGSLAVK